jgi:diguanylate cyclase (GGDEF)-like protein
MQSKEKFSILLVDDDLMVVRILNSILSEFTPVRFATSARKALRLARESTPDLVLLDVDMPETSGFEICKSLKCDPALAEVPIIFISSHRSAQLEAKGLALGAVDFIGKPPHAPLVLARVRTYQRLKSLSETTRSAVKLDFLTGAVTQRQIEKALTEEWMRALRSQTPLAFLLADIEGFTAYNAAQGDEQGDACLKSLADVLRTAARRPTDLLGRYGGGKLALLLPNTDSAGVDKIAQRIVAAVRDLHSVEVSLGAGCRNVSRSTIWNAAADGTPNVLIAAAEQALRMAKSAADDQIRLVDVVDIHRSLADAAIREA